MRNIMVDNFDGNAARKIEYDVYSENPVLKEKKRNRASRKVRGRVVFSIILVFVMGLTVMYRYALATEISYEIDMLNRKYAELTDRNAMLKVEIEEKTDLDEVRKIAENELGMIIPKKSQTIHVRVPGEDFTVVSEEYRNGGRTSSGGNGAFAVIMDRINRLSKLLY